MLIFAPRFKLQDMDKNIIQKIILENQELVEQVELVEQLIAKGHDIEEMVYINFDDERIANMKSEEMDLIIQAHQALSPKKPILFLDEIQNIEGWEPCRSLPISMK